MATLVQNTDRIKGGAEEIKKILLAEGKTPGLIETFALPLAESIVDTPTEQLINGTRTTASGASIDKGIAVLKGLRGKAVKVNQLFSLQEYDERAGLAIHASSNGKFTIVGTTSQSVAFGIYNVSLDNRPHKFVVKVKTTKASSPTFTLWLKSNYSQYVAVGNSVGDTTAIVNCTADGSSLIFVIDVAEGNVYDWEGSIQAVDLTALGWDDITTYDEFKTRWKTYYGSEELPNYYTEGEILVSKPSRLISKDADGDVLDSLAITLPSLFADGILSVGDVADEWGTKATKRVGMVKMKNLSWWESGYSFFNGNIPSDLKLPESNYVAIKGLCSRYKVASSAEAEATDMTIGVTASSALIRVTDNRYTDVASFVASLTDDDILLYELATPIEEQTPFPIGFYKAEPNGTEEVQDAESNPTLLDGFIGYEGMDTIANLASAWGIDADKVGIDVCDGTEIWIAVQMNDIQAFAHPVSNYAISKGNMSCPPYKRCTDSSAFGDKMYWTLQWWVEGIHIADLDYADVDSWKAHLADLYASGCPLTIYYEKA